MNRLLYLSLFCFLGLYACGSRHSRHIRRVDSVPSADSAGQGEVHGGEVIPSSGPMDTSLRSLKVRPYASLFDVMSQDWKMDDADKAHWNEIFWDTVSDKRQFPELALFSDFTVTENARCRMRTGVWAVDKNTRELVLQFGHGQSRTYIVRDIAMKQMELIWRRPQDSVVITLSAEAVAHKRREDDPFYPANNRWRIKPAAPETDEQLRLRVKQCVHFYALFFHDNYQRGEMEISYSGLPNCFNWYNGGIGMLGKEDLSQKWIDCFYSTYQALKGYDMIASLMGRHKLKWPDHPTSWVKEIADVLDQMSDLL